MKLKLISIFITINLFSQSNQEGVILYSVKNNTFINASKIDSLSPQNKLIFKRIGDKINKASKTLNFELKFNKKEAIFKAQDLLEREDNNFGVKILDKGLFYTDIKGDVLLKKEAFGDTFLIKNPIDNNNWKLLNETKIINGYTCYKATNTKHITNNTGDYYKVVEAWYAPKIPVIFGPEGFGNLPGLILQLSIEKGNTYVVEKIIYKKIKIKKPTKGKMVSLTEYNKIGKQAFESLKMER